MKLQFCVYFPQEENEEIIYAEIDSISVTEDVAAIGYHTINAQEEILQYYDIEEVFTNHINTLLQLQEVIKEDFEEKTLDK